MSITDLNDALYPDTPTDAASEPICLHTPRPQTEPMVMLSPKSTSRLCHRLTGQVDMFEAKCARLKASRASSELAANDKLAQVKTKLASAEGALRASEELRVRVEQQGLEIESLHQDIDTARVDHTEAMDDATRAWATVHDELRIELTASELVSTQLRTQITDMEATHAHELQLVKESSREAWSELDWQQTFCSHDLAEASEQFIRTSKQNEALSKQLDSHKEHVRELNQTVAAKEANTAKLERMLALQSNAITQLERLNNATPTIGTAPTGSTQSEVAQTDGTADLQRELTFKETQLQAAAEKEAELKAALAYVWERSTQPAAVPASDPELQSKLEALQVELATLKQSASSDASSVAELQALQLKLLLLQLAQQRGALVAALQLIKCNWRRSLAEHKCSCLWQQLEKAQVEAATRCADHERAKPADWVLRDTEVGQYLYNGSQWILQPEHPSKGAHEQQQPVHDQSLKVAEQEIARLKLELLKGKQQSEATRRGCNAALDKAMLTMQHRPTKQHHDEAHEQPTAQDWLIKHVRQIGGFRSKQSEWDIAKSGFTTNPPNTHRNNVEEGFKDTKSAPHETSEKAYGHLWQRVEGFDMLA